MYLSVSRQDLDIGPHPPPIFRDSLSLSISSLILHTLTSGRHDHRLPAQVWLPATDKIFDDPARQLISCVRTRDSQPGTREKTMKILLVDDDKVTLSLLEKSLRSQGHLIVSVSDGSQAWETVRKEHFDIVISDWLMPEIDGIELCKRIRGAGLDHYIYLILISSQDTRADIVNGLKAGVDDYLTKPINIEELKARVEIGQRIVTLEHNLKQRYQDLARNYYQTIHMFTQLLEVFDERLGGHCRRVGRLCLQMARVHPGVSDKQYAKVEAAGLVHDIGMVGLPPAVYSKPQVAQNAEEKQLYRSHPERGALILDQVDMLKPIAEIVRLHHEQYNGRGFPDSLAGEDIPLLAQLVSAASLYDDLRHIQGLSPDDIPEHLQRTRGYQLAPEMVDLLLEIHVELIEKEKSVNDLALKVGQLKEGMVLARNIYLKTGAFIMAADTKLTADAIEKLKHYVRLNAIADRVYVHKVSSRS